MTKKKLDRAIVIPDTQVRKGVPLDHLTAAGNYIVDKKPDIVVMLGDFADFPSISNYNSPTEQENMRLLDDIEYAKKGMETLLKPILDYNKRRRQNKKKLYTPRMVMLMGNHEHRVARFVENHPVLWGILDTNDPVGYADYGWELVPFEHIININGVRFCHYFRNPQSLKGGILGGTMDNKLNKLGWSFIMGHQQHLQYGIQHLSDGTVRQGIVAGAFYMHDEKYMGPQKNDHWRGIIVLNEMHDGKYDPCFVSLRYLLEHWV